MLYIATNTMRLKTGFVVQGHICNYFVAGNVWMWSYAFDLQYNYIFYIWSISYDDDFLLLQASQLNLIIFD